MGGAAGTVEMQETGPDAELLPEGGATAQAPGAATDTVDNDVTASADRAEGGEGNAELETSTRYTQFEHRVHAEKDPATKERLVRIGEDWQYHPWLIIAVNAYVLVGMVPAIIILAVFEAGRQPAYFDGLELPSALWGLIAVTVFFGTIGMAAGIALIAPCSDGTTRTLCKANIILVPMPVVLVGISVYGCVDYSDSAFAEEHGWTVGALAGWVVWSTIGHVVWGISGYVAWQMRCIFDPDFVPLPVREVVREADEAVQTDGDARAEVLGRVQEGTQTNGDQMV